MGLKDHLRRLEREARGEMISIRQHDGTVKRFPKRDMEDAFRNLVARCGAGEGAPPEHPLLVAARNSPDAEWANSIFSSESWTESVKDLSES